MVLSPLVVCGKNQTEFANFRLQLRLFLDKSQIILSLSDTTTVTFACLCRPHVPISATRLQFDGIYGRIKRTESIRRDTG